MTSAMSVNAETTTRQPPRFSRPDPLQIRYFFIGGAAKSGTSFIQMLLDSHPEVGATGEAMLVGPPFDVNSWINEEQFRTWAGHPNLTADWLQRIDQEEVLLAVKRSFAEWLLWRRWKPGVKALGDKTPSWYNMQAEALHTLFPDATFIDALRDGRDVAVSNMFEILRRFEQEAHRYADPERGRRIYEYHILGQGDPVPLFTPEMLRLVANDWRLSVLGGQRASRLFGDQYVQITYEQLRSRPAETLASLCDLLGVDSSDAIVQRCVEENSFEKKSGRKPGEADPKSYYRKGVVGDWPNHMTPEDKALFHEVAGKELIQTGYVEDASWCNQ